MNTNQMSKQQIHRSLVNKASKLHKDPIDVERAQELARIYRNWTTDTSGIKTAADIIGAAHTLDQDDFVKWIALGSSIARRLGFDRENDEDTETSDMINEVADEFAGRWIAAEWVKMTPNDPNQYELDQAAAAAQVMFDKGFMDVYEAITDVDEVFEAADNIACERYNRLGYKFIEHTVTPADNLAWADAEQAARELIERAFDRLGQETPPTLDE